MVHTVPVKIPFRGGPDVPLDPALVAPMSTAASPELTGGRRVGVLVQHGFTGNPASMFAGYADLRRDLPRITVPVLFFRSAEDHVVDISSSRAINAGLSSKDFEERVLEDSYHVATLDNDAPRIFAESAEFIERVTAAPQV